MRSSVGNPLGLGPRKLCSLGHWVSVMAKLIYIGSLRPMDRAESNNTNEAPDAIRGTYHQNDMLNVSVDMSDNYQTGITYNDDYGLPSDTFTYDLGAGEVTSGLDAEARFSAKVVNAGSGGQEAIEVSVYQLQNGDTFVRLPDGHKITELSIKDMIGDGFDGIYTGSSSTSSVVCFVAGTRIETPNGPRHIETLRIGDHVLTRDNGAERVIWAAKWTVIATERTAPIRIQAGALALGIPDAPLFVSPQHRIYVESPVAFHMFGTPGGLVAAHHLVGLPGVTQAQTGGPVTYVHIACPKHELISAHGIQAETLMLAPMSRAVIEETGIALPVVAQHANPVRPLLARQKQRQYIRRLKARHVRHQSFASEDLEAQAHAVPSPAIKMGRHGCTGDMPQLR